MLLCLEELFVTHLTPTHSALWRRRLLDENMSGRGPSVTKIWESESKSKSAWWWWCVEDSTHSCATAQSPSYARRL